MVQVAVLTCKETADYVYKQQRIFKIRHLFW